MVDKKAFVAGATQLVESALALTDKQAAEIAVHDQVHELSLEKAATIAERLVKLDLLQPVQKAAAVQMLTRNDTALDFSENLIDQQIDPATKEAGASYRGLGGPDGGTTDVEPALQLSPADQRMLDFAMNRRA